MSDLDHRRLAELSEENEALRAECRRLRGQLEEATKAQAKLTALIENTDDYVLFSDADAKPVFYNTNYAQAIKALLGIDMQPGVQPHQVLPEAERAFWDDAHRRVLGGEKFKVEFAFDAGGEQKYFEVFFNPVRVGGRVTGFSEHTRDVTEQKKVLRAVQAQSDRSEEAYRLLYDKMLDGFAAHEVITDERGEPVDYRFLAVNPAFERLTGFPASRVLGQTLRSVPMGMDERCLEAFQQVATTGRPVRFESYSSRVQRHFEIHSFRTHPGQFACILQDVTVRKTLEIEQRRTERLESLGLLAGGIAHDFNNILGALLASVQVARRSIDPPHRAESVLGDAEDACYRASDLTKQLLTFAKGGAPVRERLALGDRIRQWTEFALRGSNVRPEITISKDIWPVLVDPGQMGQVMHNLVINADQAMPSGGTLRIQVSNVGKGDPGAPAERGRFVCISVSDDGVGMSGDVLPNIFDPYFTTKESGSGLGLASSYSIVRNHGGRLTADSIAGRGSTFEVVIPACDLGESDSEAPESGKPAEQPAPNRRVLLMDDDSAMRTTVSLGLELYGFDVEVATRGEEALELYRTSLAEKRPFAVVLLDLTIRGGLGGKETIGELLRIDPRVRAVVMSGYSHDAVLSSYGDYGFRGGVAKPFQLEELADTLSRVIIEED